MEQYLIDTNIISDYFSNSLPLNALNFIDTIIDDIPNLSVITQIELLCWKIEKKIYNQIENFILDCNILNISPEIIKNCINIRLSKKIKLPDAIIAATAISQGLTLITRNIYDFENISELKILNPWELH